VELTCSIDEITKLGPEQVKKFLDTDTMGAFQLVDVRQSYEYEEGHIPGAKWIPLGELEYRHQELEKEKNIITYCRSGHRGMAASILLCGLGFKNIYNLDGGMLKWPYELVKGIPEERPELITGKEAMGDILKVALMLEQGAFDFYSKARELIKEQRAVEAFKNLAEMEAQHIERLSQHYSQLLGKGIEPPFEELKEGSDYMEGGLKITEELLKIGKLKFLDDLEPLEIALEKEYMAYDFYKRMAHLVGDTQAKKLLHELAGEERSHINVLLQHLEKPRGGAHK
jgi:rhodanese-related sulfurtransferase/rubrerythrin